MEKEKEGETDDMEFVYSDKTIWDKLKDEDFWKKTIQPRALEILELLSFLGGVTLTALIASGVLALGSI